MSISSKKKDRDKDSKGAAPGGEASANYTIGTADRGGKTSESRKEEEMTVSASTSTSTTPNRATAATSASQPPRDETPAVITTAPTMNLMTTTQAPNTHQLKEQQQQSFNKAIDETRDNIRKSIDEARSQIPQYTQAANEYQEQTIQTTREIADNFLESQREIINSLQSAWLPQIDATYRLFTSNWISPRHFVQIYVNMVSSFTNNIIASTRLANNVIFANMEAFRVIMQQTKDNAKEFSRIAVSNARTLEQTARDTAATSIDTQTSTYFPSTSSGFHSGTGYSVNEHKEQQPPQIPTGQNEADTQSYTSTKSY